MAKVIAAIILVALVGIVFVLLPDNDLTRIEGYTATQVAVQNARQARATSKALTPTPSPIPTPDIMTTCLLPPPDTTVVISESIPTAWDAFEACFESCVETNGVDATNFHWWLQQNGYGVAEANIVHKGDVFNCYSRPGWWSE
jgi:hypothetical protein